MVERDVLQLRSALDANTICQVSRKMCLVERAPLSASASCSLSASMFKIGMKDFGRSCSHDRDKSSPSMQAHRPLRKVPYWMLGMCRFLVVDNIVEGICPRRDKSRTCGMRVLSVDLCGSREMETWT